MFEQIITGVSLALSLQNILLLILGSVLGLIFAAIPGLTCSTALVLMIPFTYALDPLSWSLLLKSQGDFVYAILVSMLLVNWLVLLIQGVGIKLFVKVLDLPRVPLMGAILAMAMFGSFAVNKNIIDVINMFASGAIAYFLRRNGFPVIPVILGLVLGGNLESNFRRALIFSGGSLDIFVKKPVSLMFIILAILMFVMPAISQRYGWSLGKLIYRQRHMRVYKP